MTLLRRALLSVLLLVVATPLHARQLEVTDGEVRDLVRELEVRSPTALRMLEAMRFGRVPVVIGTRERMAADMTRLSEQWDPRTRRAVGLMAAVFAAGAEETRVGSILIALDIERIDEILAEAAEMPTAVPWDVIRREELLAVLGHELSHAYGLVRSGGDIRAQCDDPPKGADPTTSCVIVAENTIRSELGIPLDWGYGMPTPAELAERYGAMTERQAALDEIAATTTRSLRRAATPTAPADPS